MLSSKLKFKSYGLLFFAVLSVFFSDVLAKPKPKETEGNGPAVEDVIMNDIKKCLTKDESQKYGEAIYNLIIKNPSLNPRQSEIYKRILASRNFYQNKADETKPDLQNFDSFGWWELENDFYDELIAYKDYMERMGEHFLKVQYLGLLCRIAEGEDWDLVRKNLEWVNRIFWPPSNRLNEFLIKLNSCPMNLARMVRENDLQYGEDFAQRVKVPDFLIFGI